MDKRVIFLPTACQIKRIALAASLCLLVAACATPGQDGDSPSDEGAEAGEADSEAMFHITTAERLVDIGEYESALNEYLAAARASSDPEIARMVTRLAGRLQDWPRATAASERWLELEPDADSAHHVRVISLVNRGLAEQAESALTGWLDGLGDAGDSRWWRRAAMLLSATADAESARAVFDSLANSYGDRAPAGEVDHAYSILLWQQGRNDPALERATAAAESSGEPDHQVWAAQLYVEAEQLERALSLYREAREDNPEDIALALSEAEVLRELEREEEALELLRTLPRDSETLYTRGIYLVQLEREQQAEAVWEELASLPAEAQRDNHAFLVGRLAELVGRDEAAIEWYERVDSAERESQARLRRAVILGRLGRLEEGRELLAQLRQADGGQRALDTWLLEAEMLRNADRAEEAVSILRDPLADNPGSTDLLYARALSAASAGNVSLAEQDLRRIIQMDGDNAMALNALGYTLTDLTDRHQEAYRLISRALEIDPDDPATLDSMGWVLHKLGRNEEAVDYLRRALEADFNPEIAAHMVEVLDALGRHAQAAELTERALADYPEDAYLLDTLQRLDRLP